MSMGQSTSVNSNGQLALPGGVNQGVPGGILQTVIRHHKMVLYCTIATLAAAMGYIAIATPMYESHARLLVEETGPHLLTDSTSGEPKSETFLPSQCEIIKSDPVLKEALLSDAVKNSRTLAKSGDPVSKLKKLLAADSGKKDQMITVAFRTPYPDEAAPIVNAIVNAYIQDQVNSTHSKAEQVLNVLNIQKKKQDDDVETQSKSLVEFRRTHPAMSFEGDKGNIITQRLATLYTELTNVQIAKMEAKSQYEAAQQVMDDPAKIRQLAGMQKKQGDSLPGGEKERDELRAQLQALELKGDGNDNGRPNAMGRAQIEQALQKLDKKFVDEYLSVLKQEWVATQIKEKDLQTAYDEQHQQALTLNGDMAEFQKLDTDLRAAQHYSEVLENKIKEVNVSEGAGALNISIREAGSESEIVSPDKLRTLGGGLMFGPLLGIILALIRDWTDPRLRSSDDITRSLGLAVMGTVPNMGDQPNITARGQAVFLDPSSDIAEAYRIIRTVIYFGDSTNGRAKTTVITSAMPGEGKTTLVSNLAIAMAQAGERVLILDADFRKPAQHAIFKISEEVGLSNYLAGMNTLEDCIIPSPIQGLDVLPCGPLPPSPSEILNSHAFAEMLKMLGTRYDQILIDSPPVLPVPDARILAALCDLTVMVVRADLSNRKITGHAQHSLSSVGAKLAGVVVNDVPRRGDSYYGGYTRSAPKRHDAYVSGYRVDAN